MLAICIEWASFFSSCKSTVAGWVSSSQGSPSCSCPLSVFCCCMLMRPQHRDFPVFSILWQERRGKEPLCHRHHSLKEAATWNSCYDNPSFCSLGNTTEFSHMPNVKCRICTSLLLGARSCCVCSSCALLRLEILQAGNGCGWEALPNVSTIYNAGSGPYFQCVCLCMSSASVIVLCKLTREY